MARDAERKIILNRIMTPDGTILISHHRHDYVEYVDKNGLEYMVDGGTEYLRRTIHKEAPYIEMSVYSDAPFDEIRKYLERGGRGIDGKQPLTWVALKDMNTGWVEACIKYNEERGMEDSFANKMYKKELKYRNDKRN